MTAFLQGVAHVNLTIEEGAASLEAARHFYVEVLGLELLPRPENTDNGRPGLWLKCGPHQQVHISAEPNATALNGNSARHAAFVVNDLEALHARLEQENASLQTANQFEGQTRFFCRDQWGNRLEFVQFHS